MAKRFTDTDKWKKSFIKSLPVEYKIFWLYILDECDNAGIWHVEIDLAELRLGIKLSHQKIRGLFKEKIVEFDNGTKWFLPDFISFQYGDLDAKNRAHKSVIDKISKYELDKIKPLVSPLQGCKDKYTDKDKEEDKDVLRDETVVFAGIRPNEDDMLVELNELEINGVIEFISRLKRLLLKKEDVQNFWIAFKIQYFDGKKLYNDWADCRQHFRNWLKDQKNLTNNGNKSHFTGSTGNQKQQQNDAANDLLSSIADDLNQTYT
jgi:hypothetical protein